MNWIDEILDSDDVNFESHNAYGLCMTLEERHPLERNRPLESKKASYSIHFNTNCITETKGVILLNLTGYELQTIDCPKLGR